MRACVRACVCVCVCVCKNDILHWVSTPTLDSCFGLVGHHQQGAECDPLESQPLYIMAYAQPLACGCKLSKITTLAFAVTMTTSDNKTSVCVSTGFGSVGDQLQTGSAMTWRFGRLTGTRMQSLGMAIRRQIARYGHAKRGTVLSWHMVTCCQIARYDSCQVRISQKSTSRFFSKAQRGPHSKPLVSSFPATTMTGRNEVSSHCPEGFR